MSVKKIIASTAGLAAIAIIVALGIARVVQTRVVLAATLPPSVLCVPNTCQSSYYDNSVQDVELKRSWTRYYVVNNTSSSNMKRINLEIAKEDIHHMQSITVGVYATDVTAAGIDLDITRDETQALCRVDRDVKSKSDLVVVTVSGATTSRTAMNISGADLCSKFGSGGGGVKVHLVQSDFDLNNGVNLQETKVTFGYNNNYYNSSDPSYDVLGTVGFKMKLAGCGSNAACRRYAGLIRADTASGDTEHLNAARNYALEGDNNSRYTSEFSSGNINIGGTQRYSREYFEFGLECSYNTAQTKYIDIYDLNDNDFVSSHSGLIGAVLQRYVYNATSKTWQWQIVPKADVAVVNSSGKIVDLDSGERGLTSKNPRLYGLTTNDWVFIPDNGNRKVAQLRYTMQPKTRYRLMILPNGFSNFFAVGVPGDAIYGLVGCDVPPPPAPITPSAVCKPEESDFASLALNTMGTFKPTIELNNVPASSAPTIEYKIYKLGDTVSFQSATTLAAPIAVNSQKLTASVTYKPISPGTYVMKWQAKMLDGSILPSSPCDNTVAIGDQPYFEVYGGDIIAGIAVGGTNLDSSIISWNQDNDASAGYGGAGSQLAAIANGTLQHFVSGARNPLSPSLSPSGLSFANAGAAAASVNNLGSYGGKFAAIPDWSSYIATAENRSPVNAASFSNTIDISSYAAGAVKTYDYTNVGGTGDVVISGGALAPNASITIYTDGNVYITGNITYSYASLSEIPRLNVYTTGNIIVKNDVTELHGIFVAEGDGAGAGGTFYSCGTGITTPIEYADVGANYDICKNRLVVYGTVVAQKLVLSRTIGSYTDTTNGGAEIFKQTPETWLGKPGAIDMGNFNNYVSLPPVL